MNGNQSGLLPVAGGLLLGIRIGGKKIPSFCPKNLIRYGTDVEGKNFLCGLDDSLFKPREIRNRRKDDVLLFKRTSAVYKATLI